jgi:hypothetical protein
MASRFSVEAIFNAVDKLSNPLRKMGLNSKKFTTGLKTDFAKAQRSVKKFSRNLKQNFKNLGRNIIRFGALAIGAGIAGAVAGIKKLAEEGDKLAKTSRQIGMTAESLQELQFAADRQGVSGEALTKSLEKLNRNVGDLRAGTGTLTTFLNKTNPALAEQLKNVSSNEEAFDLLTREINKLPNAFDKSALAQAAFGRSGIDMLKLLEAGPDGIADLRKEARSYGLITNENAALSEKFVDELTNLKAAAKGLFTSIGSKLIPVFTKVIKKVKDFIIKNKELIKKGFEKIVKVGKVVFTVMGKIFKIFVAVIKFLKPLAPIIIAIVAAFVAYNTALKIAAAAQLIMNAAMTANPVGLIIVAIGALIGVIIFLVKNFDKVKIKVKEVWDKFLELLDNPLFAALSTIFAPFLTIPAMIIKHWEPLKAFFKGIWEGLKLGFTTTIDGIKAVFFTFLDILLSSFGNLIKGIMSTAKDVGDFLKLDTSGLDEAINKLDTLQGKIRGKSLIGGVQPEGSSLAPEEARREFSHILRTSTRTETVNRQEVIIKNDGTSEVETDSGTIPSGGTLQLKPSG